MLLPLSSHFYKQVRDYGVQKHQLKCSSLFQNVRHKGRNSEKPEIHTDPFLTFSFFFVYDFEPCDSLGWQPYRSMLHFVTWTGYKVAPVWKTLDEANSFNRAN